jgi:hypothetical protein
VAEFSLHAPSTTGLNGYGEGQAVDDDATQRPALHVNDDQDILKIRSQLHSLPLSVNPGPELISDRLRSQ